MGATAAVTMGVGTGLKAYGDYQASRQQAGALDQNAAFAEQQADDALRRGFLDSARHLASVRRLQGTQKAAYATQGVNVGSGSASDVRSDTGFLGELDAMTIRNNAAMEAFGFRSQANAGRDLARRVRHASGWDVGTTLLTGGGQTYATYASLSK